MAPLNENTGNAYPEAQIPGMTLMNDGQATASAVSLRTHSSKFPVNCYHFVFVFFFMSNVHIHHSLRRGFILFKNKKKID